MFYAVVVSIDCVQLYPMRPVMWFERHCAFCPCRALLCFGQPNIHLLGCVSISGCHYVCGAQCYARHWLATALWLWLRRRDWLIYKRHWYFFRQVWSPLWYLVLNEKMKESETRNMLHMLYVSLLSWQYSDCYYKLRCAWHGGSQSFAIFLLSWQSANSTRSWRYEYNKY